MLYRKISSKIIDWINNGDKPLLVTGARQVGKTYLIKNLLEQNECDYIEINFVKSPALVNLFEPLVNEDSNLFNQRLELINKKAIKPNTIVFFDEIQECSNLITTIKYLAKYKDLKFILSGSLLGVELKNIRSTPTGYLSIITMYPLDLEEFYIANGLSNNILQSLKDSFDNVEPVDEFIHKQLIESFYQYLVVGGMPEAVKAYIDDNDKRFNKIIDIHQEIIKHYYIDFTKYEKDDKKLKLKAIYDLIPAELNQKNKRYNMSQIKVNAKYDRYENSFNWLIDAGVALPVYNVTEFVIPLKASKKSSLFKLFLSDIGMLTTLYGSSTILKLLGKEKDINCGAIFENFVAQELTAHNFDPYYFNNKKHGEVDFLIEYRDELLPIKVKSGKDYQTHSALNYFMSVKEFSKAFVLSNFNVSRKGDVIYYPIYMTMFIKNEIAEIDKTRIDFSLLNK